MFSSVEFKFSTAEHKFNTTELTFNNIEHNFHLYKKTLSISRSPFFYQQKEFFPILSIDNPINRNNLSPVI